MTVTLVEELEAVLARRAITPAFQPIVDLATGDVVAYEALARGPVDSPLQMPDALFATAHASGRVAALDELCRTRAVESAIASGLRGPAGLFVNVEPATLAGAGPSALFAAAGRRGLRVVVELTERALTRDPASLLAFAERVRAAGGAIALDDVGAEPESLALMPFLRPEVVKLDLRLVQRRPDPAVAEIMTAVTAYAEQSDAVVLAEGIEDESHERTARSLGATLGQGWHFGHPAPLPATERGEVTRRRWWSRPARTVAASRPGSASALVLEGRASPTAPAASPFGAVEAARPIQRGDRRLLLAVSTHLEEQAAGLGEAAVVLAAFERAATLTEATARRYRRLAESAAFVAVLGAGMAPEPVEGVRGAELDPGDPVLVEWDVVVVGPHFAAALVAREVDPTSTALDRSFDYVLTYDRPLVLDVARTLMCRALPAAAPAPEESAAVDVRVRALAAH